jgi:ketosteroid isomerase-like protein
VQNHSRILAGIVALSFFAIGCTKKADEAPAGSTTGATAAATPATTPVDHTADVLAMMRADSAWERYMMSKSVDSLMQYYTADAMSYGYGTAPASGTDQIRAEYTEMVKTTFSNPKTLNATVKFSDDGSIAYDYGTYQMTAQPPGGKAAVQTGGYVNVWKKTPAGWKIALEMSTPVPAPK